MYEFKLADLGEGMHEAEIVEWLVDVGDTARLDQTIAKVETDKAIVELPAPVAGRVSEIRVKGGETARVGQVLVVFETEARGDNQGTPENGGSHASTATPTTAQSSTSLSSRPEQAAQPTATRPRVKAAPAVRKLAFELGVDLEQVTPSGASGRISLEDVRAYAERAKMISTSAQNGTQTIAPAHIPDQEEQAVPQPMAVTSRQTEQHAPS